MKRNLSEKNIREDLHNFKHCFPLKKPMRKKDLYLALSMAVRGTVLPEEKKEPQTIFPSAEGNENYRILVAEDNEINRKVILSILEKLGYRADSVDNGKELIEVLKTRNYDLVLMDCQMPVMDGYEATQKIRNRDEKILDPQIPIIAVTAHALSGDMEKCLQCGMNDYIKKPIDVNELIIILKRWLKKNRDLNPA